MGERATSSVQMDDDLTNLYFEEYLYIFVWTVINRCPSKMGIDALEKRRGIGEFMTSIE